MVLHASTRTQVKRESIIYPTLKLEPADSHNVVSQERMELNEKPVFVPVEAIEEPVGGCNIPAGAVGAVVESEILMRLVSTYFHRKSSVAGVAAFVVGLVLEERLVVHPRQPESVLVASWVRWVAGLASSSPASVECGDCPGAIEVVVQLLLTSSAQVNADIEVAYVKLPY